jgi:hypothetical protein
VRVVDADAPEFGIREEDLGDDAAKLAERGGEAVAGAAVFRGEDFSGYGKGGCVWPFSCCIRLHEVLHGFGCVWMGRTEIKEQIAGAVEDDHCGRVPRIDQGNEAHTDDDE